MTQQDSLSCCWAAVAQASVASAVGNGGLGKLSTANVWLSATSVFWTAGWLSTTCSWPVGSTSLGCGSANGGFGGEPWVSGMLAGSGMAVFALAGVATGTCGSARCASFANASDKPLLKCSSWSRVDSSKTSRFKHSFWCFWLSKYSFILTLGGLAVSTGWDGRTWDAASAGCSGGWLALLAVSWMGSSFCWSNCSGCESASPAGHAGAWW